MGLSGMLPQGSFCIDFVMKQREKREGGPNFSGPQGNFCISGFSFSAFYNADKEQEDFSAT